MTWSMSHVTMGGNWGDWVEVGWRVYGVNGISDFRWKSEWGLNFTVKGSGGGGYPCPEVAGAYHAWATTNVPNTNNWNLRVDCFDGNGSQLMDSFSGTTYSRGTPTGETGRRAGVQTGMSDNHRYLKWKDVNGDWNDWTDPACRFDDASNWQGHQLTVTRYEVIKGSANC